MWPFRATRRPTFASNSDLSNDMIPSLSYAAARGALGWRESLLLKVDTLWLGPVLFLKK